MMNLLGRVLMKNKILVTLFAVFVVAGCGVERDSPEYDQLRYDELQSANCNDMASVLSAEALMESPEDFDTAFKRCQDLKSLTFEQYKLYSDHGRQTGVWDIYAVFPEKR